MNTHKPNTPLPLYYADHDPQKAATGLAVLAALKDAEGDFKPEEKTQNKLWQAYFSLRGETLEKMPEEKFLPQKEWLKAAAYSAEALPGGVVLAATLKKPATPASIPEKVLEGCNPALNRQSKKEPAALALAADAIAVWHKAFFGGAEKAAKPQTPLEALVNGLMFVEPHDFAHLPKERVRELKDLHLALVLCGHAPQRAENLRLADMTEKLEQFFSPFQQPRFDGLGEEKPRTALINPHGYSKTPKGIFKILMAENIWLRSLPVYWQGGQLTPEEQSLLAQGRRESGLAETLQSAFELSAFKEAATAGAFNKKAVTRKNILERIIRDAINNKEL